jgi:hypothetical protein
MKNRGVLDDEEACKLAIVLTLLATPKAIFAHSDTT